MFKKIFFYSTLSSLLSIGLVLKLHPSTQMAQATPPQTETVKEHESSPKISEEKKAEQPVIQIAILLDTSSSMNGLINQTI